MDERNAGSEVAPSYKSRTEAGPDVAWLIPKDFKY